VADKPQKPARRRSKPTGKPRIRVEEVAAAAGVSSATVSRALNRTGPVGKAIRQRIEKVVAELGYVPNGAARALASHRTRAIGVVIPTLENANFSIMAESAQRHLNSAGYHMVVASSSYEPAQEWEQIQSLVAHGVDGVILVGARRAPEVVDYLKSRRVQFVVTWTLADADTPCVGFDNAAAARRLASHLLDLGHTQIGVIAGLTKNNDRAAARIEGIRAALSERGLAFPRELLIERPYKIAEGQFALRTLLAAKPRPTAVICGNDQLAFGALIECERQKIKVPRELSVVGFDDLEFASQIVPSLTTIRVPAEEIGARAAEMLLSRLSGTMSPTVVEIEVSLVVRDSSAALRRDQVAEDKAMAK
jgi:LacI family transcriptional regulator